MGRIYNISTSMSPKKDEHGVYHMVYSYHWDDILRSTQTFTSRINIHKEHGHIGTYRTVDRPTTSTSSLFVDPSPLVEMIPILAGCISLYLTLDRYDIPTWCTFLYALEGMVNLRTLIIQHGPIMSLDMMIILPPNLDVLECHADVVNFMTGGQLTSIKVTGAYGELDVSPLLAYPRLKELVIEGCEHSVYVQLRDRWYMTPTLKNIKLKGPFGRHYSELLLAHMTACLPVVALCSAINIRRISKNSHIRRLPIEMIRLTKGMLI